MRWWPFKRRAAVDFSQPTQIEVRLRRDNLKRLGFEMPRQLASGEWAALRFLPDCTALYVGLNAEGVWTACFAYPRADKAVAALRDWDGRGFPPNYDGMRI